MRAKEIVIGESYRHKDHPNYCWEKAAKVLRPTIIHKADAKGKRRR